MLSLVKQTGHTKSPSTKSLVGYQVFLRRWGLPYLFSLEGAVHGEEFAESSFYFGRSAVFLNSEPGVKKFEKSIL